MKEIRNLITCDQSPRFVLEMCADLSALRNLMIDEDDLCRLEHVEAYSN